VFAGAFGVVLTGALLVGAMGSAPAATTVKTGCPHANAQPGAASTSELRHATLCLINRARATAGADPLSLNSDLERIARHHTKTMLSQDCLKHQCGGEPPLADRLKGSGYLDGASKWWFAEDIGYESTPKRMVSRWLNTTLDDHNLLNENYVDVGIGPGAGAPQEGIDDSSFDSFTIDLAHRKPAG
jgi:uncharacterized protein YkwD